MAVSASVLASTIAFVGAWEGLRTSAYRDVVGIPTVCFGETRGVKMGDKHTVAECKDMLGSRLIEFAAGVEKCLPNHAAIPDKVYVSFVSLAYNIGTGAFCKSTVAKRARAGDFRAACNAILAFNKAGGRKVQGLVNRRNEERALCLAGVK